MISQIIPNIKKGFSRIASMLFLFTFLLSEFSNSLLTENSKGSLISSMNSNSFLMAPVRPAQTQPEIEHSITITGTASRTVQTDQILIALNVETLNADLGTSYTENTQASNKLSKVFSDLKVPSKNITTTSYDTSKQYRSVWVPFNSTWGRIFEGFKVSNKLEIRLANVQLASQLIENALAVGPVLITSISFDYSRKMQKKLKDELLPLAAKDAINRAKISAQALRVVIDDVKSANVNDFMPIQANTQIQQMQARAFNGLADNVTAPEIFEGRTKVDVSIFVNFIISKE